MYLVIMAEHLTVFLWIETEIRGKKKNLANIQPSLTLSLVNYPYLKFVKVGSSFCHLSQIGQGHISRKPQKLFGPGKPLQQNLEPYHYTDVLFVQGVSGACTSPFLDADKLKMALLPWKVSCCGLLRNRPQERNLEQHHEMYSVHVHVDDDLWWQSPYNQQHCHDN